MNARLICRCGLALDDLDAYDRHIQQHAARDQFLALLDNARRDRERSEAALKRLRKLTGERETP